MQKTLTIALDGVSGNVIDIECQLSNGLPQLLLVGLGNKAVDEAKERVKNAFNSSKLQFPKKRIAINLAPADLPKEGTGFDLGIALSILLASGQIKEEKLANTVVFGELGLDGTIRPVRGVIGCLSRAKELGITRCIIPYSNLSQASLVPGLTLIPVSNLSELYLGLTEATKLKVYDTHNVPAGVGDALKDKKTTDDFSHVIGQARAKRALEIAAAGGHNVLLSGPPGTGKSMLAKALPSILPKLTREEMLEITHLHSLARKQYDTLVTVRPFRAPHHSASGISLVGGGTSPRPGEISLAHKGVLFLDEFPEFGKHIIDSLRQPLEDNVITVSRAKNTVTYPANFMLVATANPCPCGYYGSVKPCICSAAQIVRYQQKVSGPILDRIDLYVDVDEIEHTKLLRSADEESSKVIQNRVLKARQAQLVRHKKDHLTNSLLNNQQIKKWVLLDEQAEDLLNIAAKKLQLSARAYMRTLRVARTIADLEESKGIHKEHVSEALQYRRQVSTL